MKLLNQDVFSMTLLDKASTGSGNLEHNKDKDQFYTCILPTTKEGVHGARALARYYAPSTTRPLIWIIIFKTN